LQEQNPWVIYGPRAVVDDASGTAEVKAVTEVAKTTRPSLKGEQPAQAIAPEQAATMERAECKSDDIKNIVRDQVFISYSHKDNRFLTELRCHLKPYLRQGAFSAWSDTQIEPSSRWFDDIKTAMSQSSVAVMLVTPAFLESDFIHEHELGPLLRAAEAGGVKILWVLVRDCSWKETSLKDYQALGSTDKPLAGLSPPKRDTAWRKVCEQVKQAVNNR
jgi:hypothetical protein